MKEYVNKHIKYFDFFDYAWNYKNTWIKSLSFFKIITKLHRTDSNLKITYRLRLKWFYRLLKTIKIEENCIFLWAQISLQFSYEKSISKPIFLKNLFRITKLMIQWTDKAHFYVFIYFQVYVPPYYKKAPPWARN